MRPLLIPAIAAAGAASLTALGIVFGRRVVGSRPHSHIRVIALSDEEVVLPATPKTTHPGTFGLWTPEQHVLVGDVLRRGPRRKTVTRAVLARQASPSRTTRNVWEGDVFHSPSQIGDHQDVTIDGPTGPLPAWRVGPESDRWAIHVHGIRTTRINALRTVPAATTAGYTSLVISYRGDGEGPAMPGNAATLGLTEWRDVEAAITYARSHGARSVLLVGWSMGASLVMLAAERSSQRELVTGAVLVSPALEWRQTMTAVAGRMHLPAPRACAALAEFFLGHHRLSKLTGVMRPIDFDALDWTQRERVPVPTLIVHSPGDQTVPFAVSRQTLEANPGVVTLKTMSSADHAWEYNVAPEEFSDIVVGWLDGLTTRP